MENHTDRIDIIVQNITQVLYDKQVQVSTYKLKDIISLCMELTAEYDESHDVDHHICVFLNAIEIFKSVENDFDKLEHQFYLELVMYASLLHDTIDHKYPTNLEFKKKSLSDFLMRKLDYSYILVNWIINNISYSSEVKNGYPVHINKDIQLCRDIVSDADKLEAIGSIGIKRCRDFSIATNPGLSDTDIDNLVAEHCHKKLLKLKDNYIRTTKGRELAEPLHQVLVDFVKNHS